MSTQTYLINIKKSPEIIPNIVMSAAIVFVCEGLKNYRVSQKKNRGPFLKLV